MKIEKKLIALLALLVLFALLSTYNIFLKKDTEVAKNEYFKLSNDIQIIQSLDKLYKTKSDNSKGIEILLAKYKSKIVSKKATKNSVEFKLSKLSFSEFDEILKEVANSYYKISYIKAKKLDALSAELECKVMF